MWSLPYKYNKNVLYKIHMIKFTKRHKKFMNANMYSSKESPLRVCLIDNDSVLQEFEWSV